jgi:TRAP-type C4-dicarboxylate transport system permease small subunit
MAKAATPVIRAVNGLGTFNDRTGRLACWIAAFLIAVMTGAVLVGVFFRYVLNDSLNWTEEIAVMSAIWVAFLVAPWAYRNGGHVAIEMIVNATPLTVVRIVRVIVNLLILWILYRFFTEAVAYVGSGMRMRANSIDIPVAWFRAIVPVSMAMLFLVGVELIIRDLLSLVMRKTDLDLPHQGEGAPLPPPDAAI